MAEFYAYRIIAGKTIFAKVPVKIKEQVRAILLDEGFENLVKNTGGSNDDYAGR